MSDKKVIDRIDGIDLVRGETILGESRKPDGSGFVLKYGNVVVKNDGSTTSLPENVYKQLLQQYITQEKQNRKEQEAKAESVRSASTQEMHDQPKTVKQVVNQEQNTAPAEIKKPVKPEDFFNKSQNKETDFSSSQADTEREEMERQIRKEIEEEVRQELAEKNTQEDNQKIDRAKNKKKKLNFGKSRKTSRDEEDDDIDYAEDEIEDNSEDDKDETEEDDGEDYEEASTKTVTKKNLAGAVITTILVTAFVSVFGTLSFVRNKLVKASANQKEKEVEIAVLNSDIQAGQVISKDDLKKSVITETEYKEYQDNNVINADGSTEKDGAVLYSNIGQITGKYAAVNINEGDVLTKSDVSDLSSSDKVIKLNVDGTEVYVPANVTAAGDTKVSIYAICSNSKKDGTTSNTALRLSEFTLTGRELSDITNGDGQSILQQLINEQSQSKDSSNDSAETEETEAPENSGN